MNGYTPRKKKIHGPSVIGAMKTIRIDAKTEIMVPVSLSDDEARQRYLARVEASKRTLGGFKVAKKKDDEDESTDDVPQKELAGIIDDSVIPEE